MTTWIEIPVVMAKVANFFLRIKHRRAEPAPNIFKMSYGFQVIRIATGADSTKMINLQTTWDLSFDALKSEAMDIDGFVFVLDDAVAFSIQKT